MAVDLRVRVPNDVYRVLTAKASEVGQSLAEFLGGELVRMAEPLTGATESAPAVPDVNSAVTSAVTSARLRP